jgi:hypothetical protein
MEDQVSGLTIFFVLVIVYGLILIAIFEDHSGGRW